jgi:hypothetical protein
MTASEKARMLRCASSFVTAAYKSTPHSSGFARLACGLFAKPSNFETSKTFCEDMKR